jgi:hypothetical protein
VKLRLTCQGTRPLVLHNVQLASPLNPYAKLLKELNAKRVKTDEDRMAIARVEFEGGMYYADPPLGPYMPAENIYRSLIDGARLIKAGKKVERGVVVSTFMAPLIYQGPRDIAGLWGDGKSDFVYIRPVSIGRQKVDRCRPIFRNWAVEADIIIDTEVIEIDEFAKVARLAGEMEGIGDFRRVFGRYVGTVETLQE